MIQSINEILIKNCTCEEIHIREAVTGIDLTPIKKDWELDTFLLSKFQNDLEAGNVGLGGLVVDNWKIRRRKIDSTSYINLGTKPSDETGDFSFIDHTTRSGVTYEYEVIPMSGDIEGQPKTIQVTSELECWWISDETESYPLFLNFAPSDIQTNIQRNIYEGFDQFPVVSYGNLKYRSGTITAIIMDVNLTTSYNYRTNFEAFINNRKQKYLKSRHGDFMIVDTFSSSQALLDQVNENNISSVSFSYNEIALPAEV
jgi:hypothetical protein